MTIIKRAKNPIVGPNVGLHPVFTPGTGVPGAAHRWIASQVAGVNGDDVASWAPSLGTAPLAQATATLKPKLIIEDGIKRIRFDGVDDYLSAAGLTAWNSAIVILRMRTDATLGVNHGILAGGSGGDVGITRATNNALGVFWTGARQTTAVGPFPNGEWQCVTIRNTDLDARAERNGVAASDTTTSAAGVSTVASLEIGRRNTAYGAVEIAEISLFPAAMTNEQMAAARATAIYNYPTLFP